MKFLSGLGAVSGSSRDDADAADIDVNLEKDDPEETADGVDNKAQWYAFVKNPRRRFLIDHLRAGEAESKRDLAKAVAAAVDTEYKNAYVSLHQTHLAPLEAIGVIDDADSEPLRPGPEFGRACDLVDATREVLGPDQWASQYDVDVETNGGDER